MSMILPDGTLVELLEAPEAPAKMEDIPGGATGLLPVVALGSPLLVVVPMWPVSNPRPGRPETLRLLWDTNEVDTRKWEAPVLPEELEFHLPDDALSEGPHRLSYRVIQANGVPTDSQDLMLTIDKTPPVLGQEEGALILDPEVIANGVTYRYLEDNEDRLEAEVPAYDAPMPGDRILWYWDRSLNEHQLVDERTLYQEDMGKPLQLEYSGEMIRERGDGARFVHYELYDRAGNRSARSRLIQLDVSATPPSRVLQWPEVSHTRGSGEEVTFDLDAFNGGLFVTVAPEAIIESGETVEVQWAAPGAVGSFTTDDDSAKAGQFPIPDDKISAHSAKVIPVYYEVTDLKGVKHASAQRRVRVSRLTSGFQAAQITEATTSRLYLSNVGAVATITLESWPLMSTDHRVTLTVTGTAQAGGTVTHTVLTAHPVSVAEMDKGLGSDGDVTVPKSFLQTLARGQQFRVLVMASFDGGETWPAEPNFPHLSLTLLD